MEMKENEELVDKVQIGGCMAGFFNIFDRPHLLSPKRISSSSTPSSPVTSQSAALSPSKDSGIQQLQQYNEELRNEEMTMRSPRTFPVMEFKQGGSNNSNNKSPWRFSKEAPRLSLDSRAVVDAKGSLKPRQEIGGREEESQRGSPSVIARLMGLEEPLPSALQRSASESRVNRFVETFNFQNPVADEKRSAQDPAPVTRALPRRKSFFDPADFFPEPRQMSGFDFDAPPPSDLETLKQLLEALKLKGLLHSSIKQQRSRNLVFDKHHQSPPIKPISSGVVRSRSVAVSPPRRDQGPGRRTSPSRQPEEKRRASPLPWRRPQPLHTRASPEIWNVEEYNRQGKTLLERCDKLLHSIAEMAASEAAGDSQPSPVSVLDASLYHEDSSPSPVMKRTLDFEDESWNGSMVSVTSSSSESNSEYVYISDILRASHCLPLESDIFSFLEKNQYLKGKCIGAQERRLIFDAVQEIVGRRKSLPPWSSISSDGDEMQAIWSEFQKMRKTRDESSTEEDLVGYVCGVLARDLSDDRWRDCDVEMSEAVLDIERLIFKDLIGETIRHLATLNRSQSLLRRRLVFF